MTHFALPETEQTAQDVAEPWADIRPVLPPLVSAYREQWGIPCLLVDAQGRAVDGRMHCAGCDEHRVECTAMCGRAIEEAVRWGEPSIQLCPRGSVVWAVPVMQNARVRGGLIAVNLDLGAGDIPLSPLDIRRAAFDLLRLAEQANLTNAALLESRRLAARRESERAEAIHELKHRNYQSIREIYLIEEPALIAAVKRGDRATARGILNRVLVGIYFMGRERPLLLKSFIMELVIMLSRSAVEAGGDPAEVLGTNYSAFANLARIETEEELCAWLVAMLERIMDAIKAHQHYPVSALLGAALNYMREHLSEELSRDDVAEVASLSPSHFSRVVKQTFGQSFTELLARMRVDKACEELTLTEKSLIQICLGCGFSDQSYFTKVFQKISGQTPGEYRRTHRASL